ncbi:MAG: serine/threonine-protein kinase [Candidatus Eremiobacteraeota bacterium]|nr:serine/threonine-protein kinase [Candidatus Eremiobacteraeota bacterium]
MTSPLDAGALLQERYEVVSTLGQGGMASVYRVKDRRLEGTTWALKEMNCYFTDREDLERAVEQFRFEASLLTRLSHANLPRVADFFEEKGRYYLVMELIEGDTLDEAIGKSPGFLDLEKVKGWVFALCDCLHYLHSQNPPIIFRDLKPGNIIVTAGGHLKLIDFGIARLFTQGKQKDTLILGTPGFAPPEQYGRGQTDMRSDIYSLGATIYYLVTKDDPSMTPLSFRMPSSINHALPPLWDSVVLKALSLDPEKRFQSTLDLRKALQSGATALLSHESVPSTVTANPVVTPDRIDLALNAVRDPVTILFKVENRGGGTLAASLSSNRDWVKLLPAHFTSNHQVIEITVDVGGQKKAFSYLGDIFLEWEGDTVQVPLRVRVERKWWEFALPRDAMAYSMVSIGVIPFVGIPGTLVTYFLLSDDERHEQKNSLAASVGLGVVSSLLTWFFL